MITRNRQGFSLMELWLTVALLIFVGAGAYSLLAAGLDLFRRRETVKRLVEAAMLLDALEHDAANAVVLSVSPNRGRDEYLRFATLVSTPPSAEFRTRQKGPWPGAVEYMFDARRHRFVRREYDYGTAVGSSTSLHQARETYAEGVNRMRFEFFHNRRATGEWKAVKGFSNGLPCLVRVTLDLDWPGETAMRTRLQRWIVFPSGPW